MTWIWPLALGGALLAAGPILIHILFRWRYRVVRFAAFRFLMESRRRSRQRLRIEELLLILLRVAVCVMIGLMLADVRSAAAPVGRTVPRAHIFILDDSLSMGQQAGTGTLFQKAVADIVRRLEALPDGDAVAVVSACRPGSEEPLNRLIPAAEAKRGDLAARLNALKPTALRADFPGALRAALALAEAHERMPVRVYVSSDFRCVDFTGTETAGILRAACGAFDPATAELSLLDFGLPCRNNLAVERIAVGRNVVVAGVSTPVRVTIRNAGEEPAAAAKLDVTLGELALPVQPVPALPPGETAQVEFACTFDAPGSAGLRVSLPPDDLPGDSACALALEVQEALRVLILDGSPHPGDVESASFALASALDPSGKGTFGRRLDVQSAATWNPSSLSAYDLVILTNVRDFPVTRAENGASACPGLRALEDYVRAGGGLAIFLGDGISTAFYNGPMHADGQGLSPLLLSDVPLLKPGPDKFVRLNGESVRDVPMLRVFSSRGVNYSQFVRFYAFVPAAPPAAQDAAQPGAPQVLASFDNGRPAVCRRALGKGAVIMWYSSADAKWTNWPKDISFLPVMNDMAWELARSSENIFDDVAGRGIGYTLPVRLSGTLSASLKTPAYPLDDVHDLALQDDGRQRTVSFPAPLYAGLYELALRLADRTEHHVLFSRHPDPKESDLTKASEADIRAAVGRDCAYIPDLALKPETTAEAAPVKAFWWAFLGLLLALLALESFLGLRFGHYLPRAKGAPEPLR